jgi:hypothetical protein
MGRSRKTTEHNRGLKNYLYNDNPDSFFYMVGEDFDYAPQVLALSGEEYRLLKQIHSWRTSSEEKDLCYIEFKKYFLGLGEAEDKEKWKMYAGKQRKKLQDKNFLQHDYFVFPPEASEKYGHTNRNHFTQTMNRLEKYGFIKTFHKATAKKRGDGFSKDEQTIWELVDDWKSKDIVAIKAQEKADKQK